MYKERKTSSKVCQERQDEQAKRIHKEKLKNIKPSIDNTSPKAQTHLENRRKRDQIKEDRQATIDKHNMMLLDKMMDIMKKPSTSPSSPLNATTTAGLTGTSTSTRVSSPSKSLNRDHRRKEYDRINQDNQMILKKLTNAKPHYNRKDWDEFETKQEKYLKNICEYPVQKLQPKKDSTLPMLGSGTASSRGNTRNFSSPERTSPSSTSTKKPTRRIQHVTPAANKDKQGENEYSSDDSLSLSDLDSADDEEFLNGLEKLKASEKSNGKTNGAKKEVDSDLDSLGSDFSDSFENDSEKEDEKDDYVDKKASARSTQSNKSKHSEGKGQKSSDDEDEKYDNEFEDDDEK